MTETKKNAISTILDATKQPLERDGHHTHAGYRYASADTVYAAARQALAKAGMTVWINEIESELTDLPFGRQGSMIKGLRVKYEIGLIDQLTKDVPPDNCETMTVYIRMDSAQSSLGARTYCVKKFLIDKFLLVAGSPDIEAAPQFDAGFGQTEDKPAASQSERVLNKIGGKPF